MKAAPDISRQAAQAMTKARAELLLGHPFFGSLALRLRFKEDSSCADLWTDGKTLAYNPKYVASLSDAALVGAQAHEVLHLACAHHVRRKGRDEERWNLACDYAVNHILVEAGFRLPNGFSHEPEHADRSVDDIYAVLTRLWEERNADGKAEAALEAGFGRAAEAGGTTDLDGGREDDEEAPNMGRAKNAESPAGEDAGPAGAGHAVTESKAEGTDETVSAGGFRGEVRDHPAARDDADEAASAEAEREAQIALAQALHRAPNMGDLPAGLARLVGEMLRPTLDWRAILRRFLENCSGGDYTWTTPNRRWLFQDIYLPSLREPRIPELVLAVDCSGSVDDAALSAFCDELSAILDAYDTQIHVLFHDAEVREHQTFSRQDLPLRLEPRGGGGTDFRSVGVYLARQDLRPACLIWFTDLQCLRFPDEPDFPVLWVVAGGEEDPPPFGEVLRLPEAF